VTADTDSNSALEAQDQECLSQGMIRRRKMETKDSEMGFTLLMSKTLCVFLVSSARRWTCHKNRPCLLDAE
jgi:hypothetical protein